MFWYDRAVFLTTVIYVSYAPGDEGSAGGRCVTPRHLRHDGLTERKGHTVKEELLESDASLVYQLTSTSD